MLTRYTRAQKLKEWALAVAMRSMSASRGLRSPVGWLSSHAKLPDGIEFRLGIARGIEKEKKPRRPSLQEFTETGR